MKEETYMSEVILSNIKKIDDKQYLVFNFDEPIEIELTSNDSELIKKVFILILNNLIDGKFLTFKFEKNGSDIFNEVAEKYIETLNEELSKLKEKYGNIENLNSN